MPQVTADLTQEQLDDLVLLARQRGVDANTALRQAISTAKLIADNVKPDDDLIIKRADNTMSKVIFK